MKTLCICLLALGFGVKANGQRPLDPGDSRDRKALSEFEADLAIPANTLECDIDARPVFLNYAFRYQAGYRAGVPLRQLQREGTVLTARFRVTPSDAARPLTFEETYPFPPIPETKNMEASLGGGFYLGEGKYTVDLVIRDQRGHACKSSWRIEHKRRRGDEKFPRFLDAGEVAPMYLRRWPGINLITDRPFRIAVFLHATPVSPRRLMLSQFDQSLLVTMLTSLFEDTPFQPVSVTAFSLQQQAEIFRTDHLQPQEFGRLLDTMDDLQLGKIDLATLRNKGGQVGLLAELVNRDIGAAHPPDAIVIIGPTSRAEEKFPSGLVERLPEGEMPLVFQLKPHYARRYPWPDTLESFTKSLDGKVYSVSHPRDFAKALDDIAKRLSKWRHDHPPNTGNRAASRPAVTRGQSPLRAPD